MRVATMKYLNGLADFLNTAHPEMTEDEWRAFLKRMKKDGCVGNYFRFAGGDEKVSFEEAKDIRVEMHRALAYLRPGKQFKCPYAALVGSLNALKLVTRYQCLPEALKPAGLAILHDSDGNRWLARVRPEATTTKELLYMVLAGALVDGTLNRLKVCPQCSAYHVVKDTKRRFCSDDCKTAFHNKDKIETGYFKNKRMEKRANDLDRARRLLREGKSINFVLQRTRLTERILRKEGFEHGR